MQARSTLQLEREKFDANREIEHQKEQHELILKMVSVGNEAQARANLKFLAESKLIDENLANTILALKDVPVLPSNTGTRSDNRAFQAVRTDDEAVELIISWEGGYSFSPGTDPSGTDAKNAGITIQTLSEYLGRQASVDELKNLPKSTILDIFKKRFMAPAEGIKNQLVRTAFLNISVWSGPNRAMRLFQTSAGRVLGKDIVADGILGPMSISLINSVPDPDLLVETADCLLIESLKNLTAYRDFGKGWIERARAFSPAKLHGVCSELQPSVSQLAGGGGEGAGTGSNPAASAAKEN
jgi:lysozyme family protein